MTDSQPSVANELEPVLLELGKALFVCQGFEGTLVLLLAADSHERAAGESGAFDAAYELFSQKTLGHLLKQLAKALGPLPHELDQHLVDGWRCRNWIVHEFLHKSIQDLQDPKGRLTAAAALEGAKLTVKRADVVANRLLDLYLGKYGLSVAKLKADADRIWDQHNPPTGGTQH